MGRCFAVEISTVYIVLTEHFGIQTCLSCQHVLILLDGRIVWGFCGLVFFIHKLSTLLITCGGVNVFCSQRGFYLCDKRLVLLSMQLSRSGTIC